MFCLQGRDYKIYSIVRITSFLERNFPKNLKSQSHKNNLTKKQCTLVDDVNSMLVKTRFINEEMKTEMVNNLAN